ncbi:MAG: cytochrome P450, partial [Fimbriimonadales bacterium]|nr:cytochrome P450 [Fimbriimonadales bacterium]
MFRARRWAGWTLILGAMAIVIVLGMLVRNEPRIQPIEPAKLAQLSEQERADWLIEQILARSQSQTPLWKLMNWLGYGWKRTGYELDITEITTLGEACLKYDKRGRWIRRLPAYAMNDSFRVVAEGHLAIWYLQRGDGRTAERVIQRIPPGEWCDIAQAYRAAWQARQGDHEGARKTLAQLP